MLSLFHFIIYKITRHHSSAVECVCVCVSEIQSSCPLSLPDSRWNDMGNKRIHRGLRPRSP